VPETSCWRAITTSSLGCRRIVKEVLVNMPASRPRVQMENEVKNAYAK
jgi:hypothetical protein